MTAITAPGAGFGYNVAMESEPKGRVMFFSCSPKHKMLLAVIFPSISCGIFFMLGVNYFREGNALSCVLMTLMFLMVVYVAIESCKKGAKLIP